MRRRDFITLLGGTTAAWPLAARARSLGELIASATCTLARNASYNVALFDAVKPDGFIDGKNLVVDDRGFGLPLDELEDHASAIVRLK
jgi:putative ABC transport system substrate-binding protein